MSLTSKRKVLGVSLATTCGLAMASEDARPIVQWGACPEVAPYINATAPIQCGNLRVPLDYTEPNSTVLWDMPLLKVLASEQPPKGSIQVNFGGPGVPVIPSLVGRGAELLAMTGDVYDLIGLDPRGTDATLNFTCTEDTFTEGMAASWQLDPSQAEIIKKRTWATAGATAGICATQGNGEAIGELVGTAFTARDMARVAEVLDDDGLIRYWGFSYGTLLGATIAAMFPDRVDRMVLDGVLNPHEYYNALADFEQFTDIDKEYGYFFETCIDAGPQLCPMAALNKTAEELEDDMWAFMDNIVENPMSVPAAGALLDSANFKGLFFSASYDTQLWPTLAALLTPLIWGTPEEGAEAYVDYLAANAEGASEGEGGSALSTISKFWAIHCSDRVVRASSYDEIAPAFDRLFNISKIQGGAHATTAAVCAQWPWQAKESYTGDFNVDTRHPVLVAGTTYDGPTSIASAHNISASLGGSTVLEVEGAGHCANSLPSTCTVKYLQAYWVNGTLPEEGAKCQPDAGAWETWDWSDTLKKMAGGNSTSRA